MRLLIVTEPYAPAVHAEAFCTTRFAQAVAAAGHEVVVITREGGHFRDALVDSSPRWSRPDGVRVIRIPSPPSLVRRLRDVLATLRSGIPGLRSWHRDARRVALAEHAARPFDVVMTRHVSERTAWIGRALHRAGATWIAYFADPAPKCLHVPPYGAGSPQNATDRRAVRRLVELLVEADAMAWTCPRMARSHLAGLGIACAQPIVIPHVGGHDGTEGDPPPRAPPIDGRREIRVLHSGLWSRDRFLPELVRALVDAAAHANARGARLVVELQGPAPTDLRDRVREAGAAGVIEFAGLAPYDRCLASLRTADGLLLVEAPMTEGLFLPTKLADYAIAGRPFLAYSPVTGTVTDLIGGAHPGRMGQTYEGARAALVRFVDALLDGPEERLLAWRIPAPEQFTAAAVAAEFARDVAGVVGGERPRPVRAGIGRATIPARPFEPVPIPAPEESPS